MTVQSASGPRDHLPVMALGVSRLGRALPAVRGLTAAGDLQQVLVANAQALVNAAGGTGATIEARRTMARQEASRTWFQRTFWVPRDQQEREQEEIRRRSEIAGLLWSGGAMLGARWAQWGLGRLDASGSARKIRRVIGVAALGPDGQLTEASEVILLGAMDGFGLSAGTRRRLETEPLPRSVGELRDCALEEPLLSAVAAIAFSAMAAATDTTDAVRRMPTLLLRLGMPQPTAEATTHTAKDEYLSAQMVLTGHYRVLQAAVAGTALQLRLPMAHIMAATEHVIACNPYEEARRANRRELGELISNGARLAAALHTGIPAAPAMSIAVSAVRHLFPQQGPAPAPHQFAAAFQAYATANSLPPAQVQVWARGEYR
jgi:hypothetical protein